MPRRRQLRGFAYNIVQKFRVSDTHFWDMARCHDMRIVEIDLLTGAFHPSLFDIWRNRVLVGMCRDSLRRIMAKYSFELQAATLRTYYPPPRRHDSHCQCILVDDRGREWVGEEP